MARDSILHDHSVRFVTAIEASCSSSTSHYEGGTTRASCDFGRDRQRGS